jgi:hypothetical protein
VTYLILGVLLKPELFGRGMGALGVTYIILEDFFFSFVTLVSVMFLHSSSDEG